MIETVDNFNTFKPSISKTSRGIEIGDKKYSFKSSAKLSHLHVDLKSYLSKSANNKFISFFQNNDKMADSNSDDLILSVSKYEDNYIVQSGNYVGKFKWKDALGKTHKINIKSRFSDVILKRMLNFCNDIYMDDVDVLGHISSDFDSSKFIVYYIFIQSLEKAFLMGLPKSYTNINHRDYSLKGKVDINRYIRKDIPFQGKISSSTRERKESQDIIDVLNKALSVIEKDGLSLKNIAQIKNHLNQHKSKNLVSFKTIKKAQKSKALNNPIFFPYKKVIEYAKIIIDSNSIQESKDNAQNESYGFLINIAELFEIYVAKLLQKEFPDWHIESTKIPLYKGQFYQRHIIPDIVMTKGNDVMVFDTKYKRMNFVGNNQYGAGDVDRTDFFQIHTYASFYQNNISNLSENYNLLCAGLLYPMETTFNPQEAMSNNLLGNTKSRFVIDGIDLSTDLTIASIINSENAFINRVYNLSRQT